MDRQDIQRTTLIKRIIEPAAEILWVVMIVLLPITSMPAVIAIVHSDSVAAPSALALIFFVLIWMLPYFLYGGSLPKVSLPLLFFVLAAFLATANSYFLDIPAQKYHQPLNSQLSALATLLVGIGFYFSISLWAKNNRRLKWTCRLLNWSGAVMLLWALAQAAAWYSANSYPQWMRTLHEFFSIGPLNRQRVLGFSLEPSWLAHQLNMLYIPLWLSATIKRFSVHRFRILFLSLENILLAGGIIVLVLTLSRIGLLAFLAMLAYLMIRITRWATRMLTRRMIKPGELSEVTFRRRQKILSIVLLASFLLIYLAILLGIGLMLSRLDIRNAKLFEFNVQREDPILHYAQQINVAARLVYWQAGWNVFTDYPWLGVGLGNAGYFIPERLSNYAAGLMEVRQLLYRSENLLNTKCLWTRILAETGIVGFSFIAAWWFLMQQLGRHLEKQQNKILQMTGLAGTLASIGLLVEGFSIDTFALPYIWFLFGMMTAAFLAAQTSGGTIYEK